MMLLKGAFAEQAAQDHRQSGRRPQSALSCSAARLPLRVHLSRNAVRTRPRVECARDVHEDARDHARSFVGTPEFEQSRDERKKVDAICAPQNPSPL